MGSAVDLRKRCREHRSLLNKEIHPNSHLQSAWNKYGPEAFLITVLCYAEDGDNLLELEQIFMDHARCYEPDYGYNILKVAGSRQGHVPSVETRKKTSDSMKKYFSTVGSPLWGRTRPEETRRKISEAHSGKVLSEETKKKISETKRKRFLEQKEAIS